MASFAVKLCLGTLVSMTLMAAAPAKTYERDVPRQQESVLPIALQAVAWCESGNRHFDKDGSVLRGTINPQDIGKYQINLDHHSSTARELGFDLFTESGNATYARYLYEREGLHPWRYSQKCWQPLLDEDINQNAE